MTPRIFALAAATLFCGAVNAQDGFFDDWLQRSDHAKADQPHWMTPLATVTPRLEPEFRTDFLAEQMPTGDDLVNFGNGKGLELIPYERVELLFVGKFRVLSANEKSGNYILTFFLGGAVPTGEYQSAIAEKRTTFHDLSQATWGPMHQPRRDGFSGKVVHRETL